jgi:hypothetical protein
MATLGTKPLNGGLAPADTIRTPAGYGGRSVYRQSTSDLICTTTPQRPEDCFYVTLRDGTWFVMGVCDFELQADSNGSAAACALQVNTFGFGSNEFSGLARFRRGTGNQYPTFHRQSVPCFGLVTCASGSLLEMVAYVITGGNATVKSGHTRFMVLAVA